MQHDLPHPRTGRLANFIFASRWLQLPLYLGLVLAQCVYVYHFWIELIHLMEAAFGSQTAVQAEHRHHWHFIHPLAEIFYQRRKLQ